MAGADAFPQGPCDWCKNDGPCGRSHPMPCIAGYNFEPSVVALAEEETIEAFERVMSAYEDYAAGGPEESLAEAVRRGREHIGEVTG